MKKSLLGCLFLVIASAPGYAALQEGEVAPEFKTRASLAGKDFEFSLKESLKQGPVVVYFYPSAYTGGCNIQAHEFAVKHDRFVAAGASVVGVSLDSIDRLNEFSADPDYCAGKFPVASDPDGQIAKSFDLKVTDAQPDKKDSRGIAIDHGFAERTTFIVTADGKVAATIGGLRPVENVQAALDTVQRLINSD